MAAGRILARRYAEQVERHGNVAEGFYWPDDVGRAVRNDVMLDLIDPRLDAPVVLVDLGCGAGDLLRHIKASGRQDIIDRGVDSSAAAIAAARAIYPDEEFVHLDLADPGVRLEDLAGDYLVANDVFTVQFEASQAEMWDFLATTVTGIWPHVRRGIAFNVMSTAVDWERDDLFHVSMDDVAKMLHGLAGRRVRFRADYGLYEYTAYATKPN
jgi:SAM-dependent methyltransferase